MSIFTLQGVVNNVYSKISKIIVDTDSVFNFNKFCVSNIRPSVDLSKLTTINNTHVSLVGIADKIILDNIEYKTKVFVVEN